MKLGLKDPRPGAIKLELKKYLDYRALPTPPANFGHWQSIPRKSWGVLANDRVGDCAIAGPAHQIMCWNKAAGRDVPFTDQAALDNYSAITGFTEIDPETGQPWPIDPQTGQPDNPTDGGTDLQKMAAYWRSHGLVDANGKAHTIEAYVSTDPGNLQELWVASFVFESITLGFALPDSAEMQTQRGLVWDVVAGATIIGGHCVPAFGRANDFGVGVSWGVPQPFTSRFFQTYNNQGIVALSPDMMVRAVSVEGFNDAELRDDLEQLSRAA